MNESKTVGLIGLGLLGDAIGKRLCDAGFKVIGFDVDPQRGAEWSSSESRRVSSAIQVAQECDRMILCLPDSKVVRSLIEEIVPFLQSGKFLIDSTTGDPEVTRELADQLRGQSIVFLDAAVLGSSEQMRLGQAMLLVGGETSDVERCQDLWEALAEDWRHLGPVGSGQSMKLVANLVLGLNRAALAEGLHFARSCGLKGDTVLDVLSSGAAYSRVMDTKGHKMVAQQFTPQARLSQHFKDVRLILETAARYDTSLPLSEQHASLLRHAVESGWGDLDNSAIIKVFTDPNRT